ncbi:MAG: OmpA family protein [Verrucomicrobia bacterium]|nr:OmpA family protein [Cytophagales bacterium]
MNGEEVFEFTAGTLYRDLDHINYIGIFSTGAMKAEADKFVFRQNQQPLNLAPNSNQLIKKENLGSNINSKYSDRAQVVAADGKTLYFVRSEETPNSGKDDIWFSTLGNDGKWLPAQRFSKPINNEDHNAVISVTPDNNTLLLMHTYKPNGSFKAIGFSLTHRDGDTWSLPKDLLAKNFYNLAPNNEYALSPDRKVLLMALQRNDTEGGRDLYVSFLENDDTFSEPVRMGNVINGSKIEMSPFVAGDGVTLYFSSNSFPGYGDCDIFMSKRLDDTWLNWSKPINMGSSVNSSNWDAYFSMPAEGNYALIVSDKTGAGDIYRTDIPKPLRPVPVVIVYGNVRNAKTKLPLDADIQYLDLLKNQQIGIAQTNPKDGSYKIVLKAGKKYSFSAEKQGFYPISDNLDLSALKEFKEIKRDLLLSPLDKGETIRLNNLFFDFAKADLRIESQIELDRLVDFLQKNQIINIELTGHTDNIGSDAENLVLSNNRLKSVKNYLIQKGIAEVRLGSKGYGESKPILSNDTEEGRQHNRRVEFRIL